MTNRIIAPYLRALRRKSALSQEDVAYLLGAITGTRISRHETGACVPPLEVVLAYEVIFGVVIAQIYEDQSAEIADRVRKRARKLHDSLGYRLKDTRRDEKRTTLRLIIKRCSLNKRK